MNIPRFRLNKKYLTSVPKTEDISLYSPITGKIILSGTSYSTIDHPEFTLFREKLGKEGYIKIERSWINGDRVTQPFYLNGHKFVSGDKFPCACALAISFEVANKTKKK